VLCCTSGASQSVIALMTGHTLAAARGIPAPPLPQLRRGSLAARIGPVTSVTALLAEQGFDPAQGFDVSHGPDPARTHDRFPVGDQLPAARGPAAAVPGPLEIVASDDARALCTEEYRRLAGLLAERYPLTMIDPAPSELTRLLSLADQLVLVTPASREAATALAHPAIPQRADHPCPAPQSVYPHPRWPALRDLLHQGA
jgi:hypothetical protein